MFNFSQLALITRSFKAVFIVVLIWSRSILVRDSILELSPCRLMKHHVKFCDQSVGVKAGAYPGDHYPLYEIFCFEKNKNKNYVCIYYRSWLDRYHRISIY